MIYATYPTSGVGWVGGGGWGVGVGWGGVGVGGGGISLWYTPHTRPLGGGGGGVLQEFIE